MLRKPVDRGLRVGGRGIAPRCSIDPRCDHGSRGRRGQIVVTSARSSRRSRSPEQWRRGRADKEQPFQYHQIDAFDPRVVTLAQE